MISNPPVTGPAWVLAKFQVLVGAHGAAAVAFGPDAGRYCHRWPARTAKRGRIDECCRWPRAGLAIALLRPVAVPPVLASALAGQNGDDRLACLLGLGVGDRHRQDHAV